MKYEDNSPSVSFIVSVVGGFFLLSVLVGLVRAAAPAVELYDVWGQRKEGEEPSPPGAKSNRQIKTLEAKAAMESAKHSPMLKSYELRVWQRRRTMTIGDSLAGNECHRLTYGFRDSDMGQLSSP